MDDPPAPKGSQLVTDKLNYLKTIEKALDRDTFMTSDDALKFGLIDKVVENREINSDD